MIIKEEELQSLRIQNWIKVKSESDQVNELQNYIPPNDTTDLSHLIYSGAKTGFNKTSHREKKPKKKRKLDGK